MKLSTKGRYGLRVMMELAHHFGQGPLPVESIARNQDISGKYIHLLAMSLRSAGLVRAVRGPSGGYELTKSPSTITTLEIVAALEGKSDFVACVHDASFCSRAENCAARDLWCDVAASVDQVLAGTTLAELLTKQRAKREAPKSEGIKQGVVHD
jgi:Rrf2 family protein